MEFRLLSYRTGTGSPRAGLLLEGRMVMDLERMFEAEETGISGLDPRSVLSILENWETVLPLLRELAEKGQTLTSASVGPLSHVQLAAPILYPTNIYCAAANYRDHSKEMGDTTFPDKKHARPYFFTKLSRQTVIGPDEPIEIPYTDAKVDWEAEIGVVMGRPCHKVSAEQAMDYVAGYFIVNDLSDRARNFREDWPFKFDWLGGKSFNTAAPMGPWITPAEFVLNPHDLSIRLWVNDEPMQDDSSRHMYFTIPEQIEYLSELLTLLPGDVISTGTPMGVGHAQGKYLKPGDRVTITIQELGTIRNPVTAAK